MAFKTEGKEMYPIFVFVLPLPKLFRRVLRSGEILKFSVKAHSFHWKTQRTVVRVPLPWTNTFKLVPALLPHSG